MKMQYLMGAASVIVNVISQIELEGGEIEEKIVATREFSTDDVPAVLQDGEKDKSLVVYGLTKLLQDRTSQLKDPEEKIAAMGEYFDSYFTKGLWKSPSEGGARKAAVDPFFAQAVAELKDWGIAQATACIQQLDKDTRAALRNSEKVAAKINELRAEAADVNIDELMADLGVTSTEASA